LGGIRRFLLASAILSPWHIPGHLIFCLAASVND
jgi:hypothetical protein